MIELLKSYDNLVLRTNSIIGTLRTYPKLLNQEENKYLHQFFDKCLFTALNQLDLIIGLKYLDLSKFVNNQIEANYFARIVAHISFEILNDLQKLAGQEIRDFIISNYSKDLLTEIDTCIKELNQLKKSKLNDLKEIRNNIFGHKNKHAFSQTETMLTIQNPEIYQIGNDIFNIQLRLLVAYQNLIQKV
jgi:DNA integrity scanning protein DisA with diadenylate cyclase activity